MARKKFYSLKKPKIRASWNRYSLYNLWNQQNPRYTSKTFFQQKWAAKSAARGYHGEHVRENQWNRQFSRHIPSVVPLEATVLAASDGSDLAAGRGSGLTEVKKRNNLGAMARREEQKEKDSKTMPYMSGVFWPLERRLDVAVWRALFASSARQARQFVVHGFVKVNGKKIRYPGYLLNPGDMFSVDPEMVHIAVGQRSADKHPEKEDGGATEETAEDGSTVNTAELRAARLAAKKRRNHDQVERKVAVAGLRDQIVEMLSLEDPAAPQARELHEVYMETYSQQYSKDLQEQVDSVLAKVRRNIEEMSLEDDLGDEEVPTATADEVVVGRKQSLKELRSQINDIIAKKSPSGTRKKELRALYQEVSKTLSKVKTLETDSIIDAFRGRLNIIEGAVDASSDGVMTLPDGSAISTDGQLQFGADGEITTLDEAAPPSSSTTTESTSSGTDAPTLTTLQSAIRAALASPSTSSIQSRALQSLQRAADFDTTAEFELLSARFTAIVGPDRAALSLEEAQSIAKEVASGGNSRGSGFGIKKAISEHLEKLSRMAEYQGTSTKSVSLLPEFAKAWKEAITPETSPAAVLPTSATAIPSPSPFPAQAPKESSSEDAEDSAEATAKSKGLAYLTPWRPRPYMSAFAFIPKYLEVNQNVCSAVYLRNPVVRPGAAEVPSPFMPETSQLVFGWYLRRR